MTNWTEKKWSKDHETQLGGDFQRFVHPLYENQQLRRNLKWEHKGFPNI